MNYQAFLRSKVVQTHASGFEVDDQSIHHQLFDWQREIVIWALRLGKAALFEECGLGKTFQQVEWARHVADRSGGKVLIISPLAVAHQTIAEGARIGVQIAYVRHQVEADASACNVLITNYDMLKEFDGGAWAGVVLDESSILKSFTGATKRMILDMFQSAPYKLACTATPAPNDHLELGNHAEFLGVMRSNEMIQRWFINDTMSAGTYRLKDHARADYWRWVTSWAVCISKPSDLGYPDDGFIIPPLEVHEHLISVDHTRAFSDGQLFLADSPSATQMWREKAATLKDRCQRAVDIIGDDPDPWIIWCDTNEEADRLKILFPGAVEVRGSDTVRSKEEKLRAFSEGRAARIITKADIAGFGLNWQHCHNQVFVGVTYSFEKTYQALRRSWRYGQVNPVHAHMIYAESEGNLMTTLRRKQESHTAMQVAMNRAMRENGLGRDTDNRAAYLYVGNQAMILPDWLYSRA